MGPVALLVSGRENQRARIHGEEFTDTGKPFPSPEPYPAGNSRLNIKGLRETGWFWPGDCC